MAVLATVGPATGLLADGAPRQVPTPQLVGLARSAAEARLDRDGLRYLPPRTRSARFEAIDAGSDDAVPEAAAIDRPVVTQDPEAVVAGTSGRGDGIGFGTTLPLGGTERGAYVSPTSPGRIETAADDRHMSIHFQSAAHRCNPLDHVDVSLGALYVAVTPYVTGTLQTDARCRRTTKRVARIDLPESLAGRVAIGQPPARRYDGLHHVKAAPFSHPRHQPKARAVAVRFGHSTDCGLLSGARVEETSRSVRITLLTGNQHGGRECLANLIEQTAVVPLSRPLGDRRIVDGAR